MRIAFLVNEVVTEVDEYTTTRLARAAAQLGHEVWYVGVGDAELGGRRAAGGPRPCRGVRGGRHARGLHGAHQGARSRTDRHGRPRRPVPAKRVARGPAGAALGKSSGRGARSGAQGPGRTVVNDPMSLVRANSKLYLEEFPERIRPDRSSRATRRRSSGSSPRSATPSSSRCMEPRAATCS